MGTAPAAAAAAAAAEERPDLRLGPESLAGGGGGARAYAEGRPRDSVAVGPVAGHRTVTGWPRRHGRLSPPQPPSISLGLNSLPFRHGLSLSLSLSL